MEKYTPDYEGARKANLETVTEQIIATGKITDDAWIPFAEATGFSEQDVNDPDIRFMFQRRGYFVDNRDGQWMIRKVNAAELRARSIAEEIFNKNILLTLSTKPSELKGLPALDQYTTAALVDEFQRLGYQMYQVPETELSLTLHVLPPPFHLEYHRKFEHQQNPYL